MSPEIVQFLENKRNAFALTVISYLIFALIFGPIMGAIFMGHLYAHEYGHVWAMQKCGMNVRTVNFIPLLGAVAVTDSQFKSRMDEAFIAIMGPLWGGAISLVAFLIAKATGLDDLVWLSGIMASVNLFNLLPFASLDGGRLWKSIIHSIPSVNPNTYLVAGALGATMILLLQPGGMIQLMFFGAVFAYTIWHTQENAQQIRENAAFLTVAKVLGLPPDPATINDAIETLWGMLQSAEPNVVTAHPIFKQEPFKSAMLEESQNAPDVSVAARRTREQWKEIYLKAFQVGLSRLQAITTTPPTRREIFSAGLRRFLHGDVPHTLEAMKWPAARFALALYLILAASLLGLAYAAH